MREELRFAVIGAGGFAEICHVPGLQSHPRARVVALCGRDRERAAARAARLGVPEVVTDYREVLTRPDIDAVSICTPNASHCEIALASLAAGKHVMCEKPLALNAEESGAMARAAEESGLVTQVAFTFRYNHGLQTLRRMVAEGAIGRPYYCRARAEGAGGMAVSAPLPWRYQRALSGTGILGDMGSHCVDVVHFAVGEIAEVRGNLVTVERPSLPKGVRVDNDDIAACWFRTREGLEGEFTVSRVTPPRGENWWFEVYGDEGSLFTIVSRGEREDLRLYRTPNEPEAVPLPEEATQGRTVSLPRMMGAFVDRILGQRTEPEVDADFGAGHRVQQVLDAIVRSSESERWVRVGE